MSATKKARKAKTAEKRDRKERRFHPEPTYASRVSGIVGMVGALALGAGVYANWIREDALAYAPYLVAAGALVLGGALWKSSADFGRVRIGDAGIALEQSGEVTRILWCDMQRISLDGGRIVIRGKEANIAFPAEAHPKATAWVISEGGRRVPDIMAVNRSQIEKLPETRDLDGEWVIVEELQITGRHCRASGKPISFERDARMCPTCGETYLKDQVPKKCLTCQGELSRVREG